MNQSIELTRDSNGEARVASVVVAEHAEDQHKNDHVYFIEDDKGFIKIGRSSDPDARLNQLRTASSARLTLMAVEPGGSEVEAHLHRKFADVRHIGEWFYGSGSLRTYISRVVRNQIATVVDAAERRSIATPEVQHILGMSFDCGDGEPSRLRHWSAYSWQVAETAAYQTNPNQAQGRMLIDPESAQMMCDIMRARDARMTGDLFVQLVSA